MTTKAAEATTTDVVDEDEDFASAFAEAVGESAPASASPGTKVEDPPKDDKVEDPPKEDVVETPAAESTPPAEQTPPAAPPGPAEPAAPSTDELLERIAKLESSRVEPATPPAGQPPAQPEEPKPYAFSDDDAAKIKEFETAWPDVAEAYALREKKTVHDLEQKFLRALGQMFSAVEERLAPVTQSQLLSDEERHFAAVAKVHADHEEVTKLIPGWIKTQPKYLQPHLDRVFKDGTTAEVIELIGDYKKATGRVTPEQSEPTPGTNVQQQVAQPAADKVAALTPTPSKRTSVSTRGVDKSDYDAGWDEATAER